MEAFRRLLPAPCAEGLGAADLAAAVPGPAPAARPFVLLNMIATADGRATLAGRTAPIARSDQSHPRSPCRRNAGSTADASRHAPTLFRCADQRTAVNRRTFRIDRLAVQPDGGDDLQRKYSTLYGEAPALLQRPTRRRVVCGPQGTAARRYWEGNGWTGNL